MNATLPNIVVGGCEVVSRRRSLFTNLSRTISSYPTNVVGMPTEFDKITGEDVELLFVATIIGKPEERGAPLLPSAPWRPTIIIKPNSTHTTKTNSGQLHPSCTFCGRSFVFCSLSARRRRFSISMVRFSAPCRRAWSVCIAALSSCSLKQTCDEGQGGTREGSVCGCCGRVVGRFAAVYVALARVC